MGIPHVRVKQVVPVEVPQDFVSNHLGIWVPSFTVAVPSLQSIGPIVEVRVAVPQAVEAILAAGGEPIPSPVTMDASRHAPLKRDRPPHRRQA